MCSGAGNWTLLQLGFPIRTSPDHSSVANSPGLIAGSYVLHRLLVPRHPPCALSSLSPQRCSRPLCSSQHTGGPVRRAPPTNPCGLAVRRSTRSDEGSALASRSFRTQQCARPLRPRLLEVRSEDLLTMSRVSRGANSRRSTSEHHRVETNARPTTTGRHDGRQVLLRKEVIQPHLPVRLPCYDLVPIASPTFDGSFHKG